MKKIINHLCLILFSFGIMFVLFSWCQGTSFMPTSDIMKEEKGIYALLTGIVLYKLIIINRKYK